MRISSQTFSCFDGKGRLSKLFNFQVIIVVVFLFNDETVGEDFINWYSSCWVSFAPFSQVNSFEMSQHLESCAKTTSWTLIALELFFFVNCFCMSNEIRISVKIFEAFRTPVVRFFLVFEMNLIVPFKLNFFHKHSGAVWALKLLKVIAVCFQVTIQSVFLCEAFVTTFEAAEKLFGEVDVLDVTVKSLKRFLTMWTDFVILCSMSFDMLIEVVQRFEDPVA